MRITSSNSNKKTNFSGSVVTFYSDDGEFLTRLHFDIYRSLDFAKKNPDSDIAKKIEKTKAELTLRGY